MRKRKFTSTKFTAKMFAVAGPTLLPLTALASPGDGRNAEANAARHAALVVTQATPTPNLTVSTLIPIVGQATLPDGKPAANAVIYVTWWQNNGQQFHQCVADAKGKFETTLAPAKQAGVRVESAFVVTALLPGKGIAWTQATAANSGLSKLRLNLMPLSTLEGRLVHADGTPCVKESVYVQSLRPHTVIRNGVSPTPDAAPQTPLNAVLSVAIAQNVTNFMIVPLLPPDALAAHFRATTDATGRFTLHGVPRDTEIALKLGGTLAMASGSANTFAIQDQERQSAGVFVATPTGRVKVRVADLLTHQPIPQMRVTLMNTDPLQNGALGRMTQSMDFHRFQTNAAGEMVSPDLLPGEYRISVLGCIKTVRVEPGKDTAPVDIAVRQGALKGRLLDADGKPVPDVEVRLAVAVDGNRQVFTQGNNGNAFQFHEFRLGISGGEAFDFQNGSDKLGSFNKALPSALVRTNAYGEFSIANMPWGSPNARVWASKGNDIAEWSGPANKIDATLTLKMRRDVLTTVSGRLIDPERRPLVNVTCKALHWLSTPRISWFATARDVKTDAAGNFKVEGMERGESFSLITLGQPQQQLRNNISLQRATFTASPAIAQDGGVHNALQTLGGGGLRTESEVIIRPQDFESPRFLTCAAGDGQNLGDVMVHPQDTPDEVLQSYGGSPDSPSPDTLPGVVLAPAPAEVQTAQAVLARFDAALKTGDTGVLAELTSHVSPGWSSNRQEFLQHVSWCGRTNTDAAEPTTQALKFVPRASIAMLLGMASPEAGAERAAQIGEASTNWIFLTRQMGGGVVAAGILHREDGQWRVVANPFLASLNASQILIVNGTAIESGKRVQSATALTPELQQSALQTGQRYMQAWLDADREQMRRLTSPFSRLPSGDIAQFRHTLERRADDGVSPLASEEKITLQTVPNLTLWDQEWLKQLAGANAAQHGSRLFMVNGGNFQGFRSEKAAPVVEANPPAPEELAPGNDTAVFRYTAQGRDFLMVLMRHNRQWQMLEAALPL